jgi:putative PIN family toxin of toxin-antitoxin system
MVRPTARCNDDNGVIPVEANAGAAPVRLVVDTNVIVSALLKPGSVPDQALCAAFENGVLLYDARMVAEYRDVLARPKLRLDPRKTEEVLAKLVADGREIVAPPRWDGEMPDDDDRMFIEVARAGNADAIVTGNAADFPSAAGILVLSPAMAAIELRRSRE